MPKYEELTGNGCRMISTLHASAERPAPMNVKKILMWALVVFVVFYLFTNPDGAAAFVSNVLNTLKSAGKSLSTFVSHV
jgi:hypothetical protein